MPWITQDVQDVRTVGYLLRKAANREWNQPKRKIKRVGNVKSTFPSDVEMQFGVFPAGFWVCIGPVFPQYDILECYYTSYDVGGMLFAFCF